MTSRHGSGWFALTFLGAMAIAGPRAAGACEQLTHAVPDEAIKALSHGFNLAGWLDGPQSVPPEISVLRTLRKAGMTHIRLPVSAERVMQRFTSAQDIDGQLRSLDHALKVLLSIGYHVSVDLHPGERFSRLHRDDPEASMAALEDAWNHLAGVIERRSPALVFAELLNEPDIAPARWQIEAETLAKFVRRLLPRTTLVIGPTNWQRADSLPEFVPLDDPNIVYAIHFYDPMVFTHQNHWDPADPLSDIKGLPFPVRADDPAVKDVRQQLNDNRRHRALEMLDTAIAAAKAGDVIDRQLQPAVAWQQRFRRPLIINEFGVLKGGAPEESRVRWLRSVAGFADRHCWGWAHWEYAQGFGLLDSATGKPDAGVMRALFQAPEPALHINQR
jgi:endoglucanase